MFRSDYGKWFPYVGTAETAGLRLIIFPYAGAGVTAYMEWLREKPADMEVFPVAYPEREKRHGEMLPDSLKELAKQIAVENVSFFREKPCIFYGHCEGGIIAFETAKVLQEIYDIKIERLVVSSANPPSVPLAMRLEKDISLKDAADIFVKLQFIPSEFAEHEMYLKCFVPVLLRDYLLYQDYADTDKIKLSCPILEMHGNEDCTINSERIDEWKNYTDKYVRQTVFPGRHFFITKEIFPEFISELISQNEEMLI